MKKWSTEYYIVVITAVIAYLIATFAYRIAPAYEKNIRTGCVVVLIVVFVYILIRKKRK